MTPADPPTLTITLNGATQVCAPGTTVADLVAGLQVAPEAVATALNGWFLARSQRANHVLQAGDSVTTFQPIEGG